MSLLSTWTAQTPDLKHFQWKNRILLVFSPSASDPRVSQQRVAIEKSRDGFEERDLIAFVVANGTPLASRFHVRSDEFAVILIGKDGTEKLRQPSIIEPQKLFELIDSMPMRRAGQR